MKKNYSKNNRNFLKILSALVVALIVIINSCKKDEKQSVLDVATAKEINEAKEWYQKNYPITTNNSSLKTQGSSGSENNDFSQILKPNWEKAISYSRFNSEVVEMPLDSATKLALVDKNINVQSFDFNKSYSKSSFLILNDGSSYSAYIMTIVADSSYLKNDFSKLSNNTYRKHDKDFSGYLLYYTPKGVFVSGWHYLNGKINKTVSVATASFSIGLKPESTSSSKIKTLENGCTFISWTVITVGYVNGNVATYFVDIYYLNVCDQMGLQPENPGGTGYPPPTGGSTGSPTITIKDTIKIGHVCNSLTPEQTQTIITTVNSFATYDCATKFLYRNLKNINLTFCISGGNSAGYVPNTNTNTKEIDFSTDYSASRVDILEHEMFHAFQDQTYNGALINYGSGNPGYANIEFEQAVFYDIIYGTTTAMDLSTDPTLKVNYTNWINSLTNNHNAYPKLSPQTDINKYTSFIDQYNSFLNQFNNIPNNPYSSQTISLTPSALINMFNSIDPNC